MVDANQLPCSLGELVSGLAPEVAAVPVTGLALNNRQVQPGDVFLAVKGFVVDGRDFIDDAIRRGAIAVIADAPIDASRYSLPVVEVTDLALHLSAIAGRFYRNPSRDLNLIGVTGTNGKTSCVWTVAQLLEQLGEPCGLIGTLGSGRIGHLSGSGINTTPDAVIAQKLLRDWADGGARWAAMEVSSHGLAQSRVADLHYKAAVFTNLTQDHLDFHGTMAAYGQEKAKLFRWPGLQLAVINRDDPFGRQLLDEAAAKNVLDYSICDSQAAVYAEDIVSDLHGSRGWLRSRFGDLQLETGLLGDFNLSNLLAACAVLLGLGVAPQRLEKAIPGLQAVPGRMERFTSAAGVLCVVDYAHTPDALEKVLTSLRPLGHGKLLCVFGCGGDRDKGKRPLMGEVACRLADQVIVTSDNPRTESPRAIVDDILPGLGNNYHLELDRAAAIRCAVAEARPGDIVLIAGKGHEEYQEINGQRHPFSDMQCLKAAVASQEKAS